MRSTGTFVSVGAHALLIFWGVFTVAPKPLESDVVEALPVEFVTIAEVTDLTKGVKTAKAVTDSEETVETPKQATSEQSDNPGPAEKPAEKPDPKPPVPEVAKKPVETTPPKPAVQPKPPKPEPEPEETAAPPVTPTPPKPEPPKPEPPKPEPPKPEPPKPAEAAPKPDPLADLIEKTPEKPKEPAPEKPAEPAVAEATPAPAPRIAPKPKTETAAVAPELIDKRKPATTAGGKPKETASLGTSTGSKGAKLTQTELDGLRDSIQRCWSLPPGYSAGRDFRAQIKATLTPDGRVDGRVTVVEVTGFDGGPPTLIKNAVRVAIEKCQPYKLPSNKYADWKDLEVTFYP